MLRWRAGWPLGSDRFSVELSMPDIEKAIDAAAQALCRLDGHAENIKFEGKPMWQSYLPEARAAIGAALPYLK